MKLESLNGKQTEFVVYCNKIKQKLNTLDHSKRFSNTKKVTNKENGNCLLM